MSETGAGQRVGGLPRRLAPAGCVLLGIVLVLPALRAGFFSDDYLQIAQLEHWSPSAAGPLDLYSFVPRDRALLERLRDDGMMPYFAAPGLKLAFLRPLSSALMWVDHASFGRWAGGYHLHSLLWYAATLLTAAALLRRVVPGTLATLALLIFCVDDAHALTVTFIAARNAAVASTLAWLGVIAHLRWRTEGWRPGATLALAFAALGLAGGEMGLGALAYLVALEGCRRAPAAARMRALAPAAVLVAVYLSVYGLTGWGAHGSDAYLDPVGAPLDFLRQLPGRVLLLLGGLLVGAPIDLALFDQRLRVPLMAIGGASALLVAVWLPRAVRRMSDQEARVVRWMALGAAGALLVSSPGLPGERVLLAGSLGGAVVIAALLRDAWRLLRACAGAARVLPALALAVLGLPNLLLAAIALPGKTILFGAMFEEGRRVARTAEIVAPVPARVVVVALDDLIAVDLPAIRAFELGLAPDELRAIGASHDDRPRALPLPDRIGYLGTTVLSLASTSHRLQRDRARHVGPGHAGRYPARRDLGRSPACAVVADAARHGRPNVIHDRHRRRGSRRAADTDQLPLRSAARRPFAGLPGSVARRSAPAGHAAHRRRDRCSAPAPVRIAPNPLTLAGDDTNGYLAAVTIVLPTTSSSSRRARKSPARGARPNSFESLGRQWYRNRRTP